jgi:alanine racemase
VGNANPNRPVRSNAVLTIDLGAVAANFRRLQAQAPGAEVAPVVKTNAYGLGLSPVARRLAAEGATTFFVAHPGEGIELRALLPHSKILVLESLSAGLASLLAAHDLTPALATPGDVEAWSAEARRLGRPLPCALHIDTGMNRFGLPVAEFERLAATAGAFEGLSVELVMSHLACADDPAHPLNEEQRRRFDAARTKLPKVRASLANSSGIFLGAPYHHDLVRPGMALYGLNPTPDRANPMKTAVRLEAPILQLRQIDKGESVGYGATYRAGGKRNVATVGVGYGDGFSRALGNRGWGFLRGCRVPIIGRISMDLLTLDVSAVGAARPGDAVELLGPNVPPDEVGAAAGTLGYEILTSLGTRYARHYVGAEGT